MSPAVLSRLKKALADGGPHYIDVAADDVRAACEALPASDVARRLLDACARVLPSRATGRPGETPRVRLWLSPSDLAHVAAGPEGAT